MGNHHAPETTPTGTPSPISGSLFITVVEVRYNGVGEWQPILFPSMDYEAAQRMADYLAAYVAPEGSGFVPEYRNIRVAHCMYSELPEPADDYIPDCHDMENGGPGDYNDTDQLI